MPIYEEEGRITREDLQQMQLYNKCQECGARLRLYIDLEKHMEFLACWDWHRTKHEGIERERSRYEKEGIASLNKEARDEIMTEQYGAEKTKALEKYMGTSVITRSVATEIVETLWGDAPLVEKKKCILLCETYQLNPLMKHIHLVGYQRRKNGQLVIGADRKPVVDWSIQMGIGATRLLAQRKHNYSYLDMSPRRASPAEVQKVFGDEADIDSVYAFVQLRDMDTGAEVAAVRGIPKGYNFKGKEKGNTLLNQVCIWAERQALDRQYPGEMPQNVEVFDERYADHAEARVINTATGEIIEGEARLINEPEPEPEEVHFCEEHGVDFIKKNSKFGTFYSHPLDGGGYCKEKKKNGEKAQDPVPEATNEEIEAVEEPTGAMTTEQLLDKVCQVKGMTTHKQARGYLVGTCKIADSRINNDPQEVWDKYGQML